MELTLRFLRRVIVGPKRLARLRHAIRVFRQSPAKSNISLENVRIPNQDIDEAMRRYKRNMELARHDTLSRGAVYLNFLQPFNGYGRDVFSKFDVQSISHLRRDRNSTGENQLDMIIDFMKRLWEQIQEEDYTFDLRYLFKDIQGEIYFDHVHLSDTGQDMISRQIADAILDIEARRKGSS